MKPTTGIVPLMGYFLYQTTTVRQLPTQFINDDDHNIAYDLPIYVPIAAPGTRTAVGLPVELQLLLLLLLHQ